MCASNVCLIDVPVTPPRRSLVAVVSPLPLLEQPLLGALRNTRTCRTALSRLVAAADVLRGGALLAGPLHLPAEAVVTLAAASSVLVVAGTPLLSRLAPPSSALHPALVLLGPDDVHMTATHLLKALYQLGDTVLPKGQAPHAAARRALLKGGFAPRRLLPFLSATVQAVEAAAESPAGKFGRVHTERHEQHDARLSLPCTLACSLIIPSAALLTSHSC